MIALSKAEMMDFRELADTFASLEATSSRLEMIDILSDLLSAAAPEERSIIAHLVNGQLGPPFRTVEFGVGERLLATALAGAFSKSEEWVRARYRDLGDLGLVAEELAEKRHDRASRTIGETYDALFDIARASGRGSQQRKIAGLTDLIGSSGPLEARYLVRVVQGRLRLGVGEQTVLEAVAAGALGDVGKKSVVARAFNVRSDLGRITRIAWEEGEPGLDRLEPEIGIPVRPALAQRLGSVGEILDRLGRVQAEPKYDGFRLQLHRDGDTVHAYSRRLEEVTGMFPEIADALRSRLRVDRAILEGEALVYNPETGEFLPFQVTMTRKRKHEVEEMAERYPLRFFAFDLLFADGTSYLPRPLTERRTALERVLPGAADEPVVVAEARVTGDRDELEALFADMVQRGLEGIVVKRTDTPYHAGARNFNWVKLKRGYQAHLGDTVDVVLVGYLTGRGRRSALGIGSLLGAVYDPDTDAFRTVGKIGSGPTEEQWRELRRLLDEEASPKRPRRVDSVVQPDVWVEPRFVVTVQADEISRSPSHTCGKTGDEAGYALRFPRVVAGVRNDKAPEDATTQREILEMFERQGAPRRDTAAD